MYARQTRRFRKKLVGCHGADTDRRTGEQRTWPALYGESAGGNPLACSDQLRVDQVTSGVVSAFKKLHDSWGPRLEDTLRNAVYATVEQGGNLLSVMRLLAEKPYRERAVPAIRDAVVRSFWMYEFAGWSDNYRTEAVAAIQNKIRPFLTNTNIRDIVRRSKPD